MLRGGYCDVLYCFLSILNDCWDCVVALFFSERMVKCSGIRCFSL